MANNEHAGLFVQMDLRRVPSAKRREHAARLLENAAARLRNESAYDFGGFHFGPEDSTPGGWVLHNDGLSAGITAKPMPSLFEPVLTEDQIERSVERKTDLLDAKLMSGALTQAEYDSDMAQLNRWAELQYAKITGNKQ